jgi:hypothetical protein
MARKKKDPSEYRPNSAPLAVRVHKDTRADIERLSAKSGKSMSALVDKAIRRLTVLNGQRHIETLVDTIVTLAQQIEKGGTSIDTDPDASRKFRDGLARVLETHTAVPAEETEELKISAKVSAETALTLVQAGVDWSDITFRQTFDTDSLRKAWRGKK